MLIIAHLNRSKEIVCCAVLFFNYRCKALRGGCPQYYNLGAKYRLKLKIKQNFQLPTLSKLLASLNSRMFFCISAK